MQKKFLYVGFVLLMTTTLQFNAQYAETENNDM